MRLFTALDIPEDWRGVAVAAQARLAEHYEADLRFVRREHLHVTARFIGEVPADQAAVLTGAIEATPPIEVTATLAAAGTFGSAARTSVAWLGITIDEAQTTALLDVVDSTIRSAGLKPLDQPWRPHLTLARVRRQVDARRRGEIAQAVIGLPKPQPNPTFFRRVSLYQSDLGNRAPRHKLLARSAVS